MSVIGPRPALWNQDVLIAEREKYHANDVKPGLTGWAQINGRDELEIPVKAKLDGEYVEKESLFFDIKCFLGTIGSVLSSDGVVEGGTGELNKAGIEDDLNRFENIQYGTKVFAYDKDKIGLRKLKNVKCCAIDAFHWEPEFSWDFLKMSKSIGMKKVVNNIRKEGL